MIRYHLEYYFFLALRRIVLLLPLKSAQKLGKLLGGIAFYLFPSRRRIAMENLANAFPEKSIRELSVIAKKAFQNYGVTIIEMLWFPNLNDNILNELINIENLSLLLDAYKKGKGMIMLSGHFGNWELIALGVARISKLQFTIIVQTQNNKLVDKIVNKHRCHFGNRVIPMGVAVREIVKTLHGGGIVAIAPDQSGPAEGVYVNFFGRQVATHQGPSVFALKTGAIMQMGFIIRKKDMTYDVILEEILYDDLNGYSEQNVKELTQRHTALLEKYIRDYPDHWLWMHRRWKHIKFEHNDNKV